MTSLIALVVLATACSGEPAAPPHQPSAAVPALVDFGPIKVGPEERRVMAEMAIYRSWDPCALHDPAAAARIFDGIVAEIEPKGFSGCELTVQVGHSSSDSWTIGTEVGGALHEQWDVSGAVELEAAGRRFHGRQDSGSLRPNCRYVMPTSKTKALVLTVRWGGFEDEVPTPDVCAVAGQYMREVAPLFANPPLRSEKVTDPHLQLPGKDPCASVRELAERFRSMVDEDEQPTVRMGATPHECTLALGQKERFAGGRLWLPAISIEYAWDFDPADTSYYDNTRKLQIGGMPAELRDNTKRLMLADCLGVVRYDPVKPLGSDRVQVIKVSAPDCGSAEEAAKIVLRVALA